MAGRICIILFLSILSSCKSDVKKNEKGQSEDNKAVFEPISSDISGIGFKNSVTESPLFNHLKYIFFYNGGGVAAGDVNNDGLCDLYFTSNQESNKLYINKGDFKFEDITESAGVQDLNGWTTGVTMVDLNNDNLLDLYVCKAGSLDDSEARRNKLFINQGDLTFKEEASAYGLDDPAFSTQSYFFDFDKDGDLDMYLVNHRSSMNKDEDKPWWALNDNSAFFSDQFYRNDDGKFKNVTHELGIENNCWGHSASIVDFNDDGWSDIYVCNDFREPDHYYLNDGKGHFEDKIHSTFGHISHYSMGSDAGDLNGDGLEDFITLDMTPEDHARSKENMTQMNSLDFNKLIEFGYPYQYMANSVQLNRGGHQFSEVAHFTGMASTDWSWGPLIADFNNDGRNDVFVSNGVKIDMTNRDYSNLIQKRARSGQGMTFKEAIESWPGQTISNYMFENVGDLHFEKVSEPWGLDASINTNGATYADLDNDGDLDLIWNNSQALASLYKNETNGSSIQIKLKGRNKNSQGIGAKVQIKTSLGEYMRHHHLSRGYLSSVDPKMTVGLRESELVESITVYWSDGEESHVTEHLEGLVTIMQDSSTVSPPESSIATESYFREVPPEDLGISWTHQENEFNDFQNEFLLPQKQSTHGPHTCVGDFNGDGREDFFMPGAAGFSSTLFYQMEDGTFSESSSEFDAWKKQEDIAGLQLDANSDGRDELYVICGGNEFPEGDDLLGDRLYSQRQSQGLKYLGDGLPYLNLSGESACTIDFDKDGDLDIFLAGRLTPGLYPNGAPIHLLENINGSYAMKEFEGLKHFSGMVTGSASHDIDLDGDEDIVMVGEWMPITILRNNGDDFSIEKIEKSEGWWYSIELADLDNDGLVEIIAGNLGLNNKFHAQENKPFHVYAHDFDRNGSQDIVLTKEMQGSLIQVRGRDCSSEQMPFITRKFPTFKDFAAADLEDVFGNEILQSALHLKAHTFASSIYKSTDGQSYEASPLPSIAQFGPTLSFITWDVNGDDLLDIIGAGGIYNTENETARYDANLGYVLLNEGEGNFMDAGANHGFRTEGNVKDIKLIQIGSDWHILVARNNAPIQIFELIQP